MSKLTKKDLFPKHIRETFVDILIIKNVLNNTTNINNISCAFVFDEQRKGHNFWVNLLDNDPKLNSAQRKELGLIVKVWEQ